LNLATNALQASNRAHGVEISAKVLPEKLNPSDFRDCDTERFIGRETLATGAPLVGISVRDSGEGMPPEVVHRIFNEPFTTRPAGQGHGIGLGSVKSLVLGARGAVHLTTAPGKGSVFTVFLPGRS
jgi:signal transduction histidine kinase